LCFSVLVAYGVLSCDEWTARGYADSVRGELLAFTGGREPSWAALQRAGRVPPWFGSEPLHLSHQSALVRKLPEHYRQYFPGVPDDLPYVWPADTFPRWPVRRPAARDGAEPFGLALAELGLEEPRGGQREAVDALRSGRDVLLVTRPGHGGSTTGLLAALTLPGRTLWLVPGGGAEDGEGPAPCPLPLSATRPRPAVPEVEAEDAAGEDAAGEDAAGEDAAGEGAAAQPAARPVPLARPPGPEDLAAMAEEAAAEPEIVFLGAGRLAAEGLAAVAGRLALVVVDRADELDDAGAKELAGLTGHAGPGPRPPVLALVAGPADTAHRRATAARLGLDDPVHAGGGYDRRRLWLGVRLAPSLPGKHRLVAAAARAAPGPGLVLVPSRARAEALATALRALGVRAAAYVPGMRASRLAEAQALYRRRRLDALVLTPDARPDLGRIPVAFVVHQVPPGDLPALYDQLALADRRGEPSASTVLVTPEQLAAARGPLATYLTTDVCRRAALLDPYGEPVAVPCGRCDVCDARQAGP